MSEYRITEKRGDVRDRKTSLERERKTIGWMARSRKCKQQEITRKLKEQLGVKTLSDGRANAFGAFIYFFGDLRM